MKVRIDDKVVFNDELAEWEQRMPDEFRDAIRPGAAPPQPYMKAVLIAMAEAMMTDRGVSILVKTKLPFPEDGWSVKVKHS